MSNFNVRGPHSNVTDQTPGVNENGKRSIRNLATAVPGQVNARSVHPRGPRVVPRIGTNIPVQNYSSQIHQLTNNTSSIVLFARARRNDKQPPYPRGSLMFAKGSSGRMSSVRDICALNKDNTPHIGNHRTMMRLEHENDCFYFVGSLNNEVGRVTGYERLYNVDVCGRSKIANIFGDVRRGDRVGLGVVQVKANVFGQHPAKDALVPFVNGKLSPAVQGLASSNVLVENHRQCIHIGVVSNNVEAIPSESDIRRGLYEVDRYTVLPQIEVLMV